VDGLGLHPSPPSRSPLSARAFGPEVLLGELIGRGGMSRVYRGWLRGNGIEVAVKILRDELASHPESVQRFVRERDLLAAVASPHVVRVHDLVIHGDELGIVMDLVPGGHLRKAVSFPCAPAEAAELTIQIADGLAAVHAAGVVHRDLKPENVLVDADGRGGVLLRLTDFGISRLVDAGTLTQTSVTGTPGYLPPEVAAGGRVTAAADMYALGVVLYELCTGRGPFIADNPILMILAHTRQEAPRPGGMPDGLWSVLSAMLAKDPAARPTADRVATILRAILPGLAGVPVCTPPPPAPPLSLQDGAPAPPTVVSPGSPGPYGAPATVASALGPLPVGGAPDTGRSPVLLGGGPPATPPTGPPLSRRDRNTPPPDLRRGGPAGAGDPGSPGALLRRPAVMAAAAAVAVLLLVLAGIGLMAALGGRSDPTVIPVTSDTATPEPTGATASAPGDSTPAPPTSDGPIKTIVAAPATSGSGRPAGAKGGSTSASPTPTPSPGVPTLTRKEPTAAELHSTDGTVTLVLGGVSAGTGTVTTATVLYDGREKSVTVQAGAVASYEVTVDNLTVGKPYSFTAKICNSSKLCSTTAQPFDFTPYGAPKVIEPSIKASGQTVKVTVAPVDANGNPNDTTCYLDVSATPADAGAPQHKRVWYGGDTVSFDGKASTAYKATVSCQTGGVDDGSASSGTATTAGLTPSSSSPTPSVTTTTAGTAPAAAIVGAQ
jgi:serine/threonine-protein kinase